MFTPLLLLFSTASAQYLTPCGTPPCPSLVPPPPPPPPCAAPPCIFAAPPPPPVIAAPACAPPCALAPPPPPPAPACAPPCTYAPPPPPVLVATPPCPRPSCLPPAPPPVRFVEPCGNGCSPDPFATLLPSVQTTSNSDQLPAGSLLTPWLLRDQQQLQLQAQQAQQLQQNQQFSQSGQTQQYQNQPSQQYQQTGLNQQQQYQNQPQRDSTSSFGTTQRPFAAPNLPATQQQQQYSVQNQQQQFAQSNQQQIFRDSSIQLTQNPIAAPNLQAPSQQQQQSLYGQPVQRDSSSQVVYSQSQLSQQQQLGGTPLMRDQVVVQGQNGQLQTATRMIGMRDPSQPLQQQQQPQTTINQGQLLRDSTTTFAPIRALNPPAPIRVCANPPCSPSDNPFFDMVVLNNRRRAPSKAYSRFPTTTTTTVAP